MNIQDAPFSNRFLDLFGLGIDPDYVPMPGGVMVPSAKLVGAMTFFSVAGVFSLTPGAMGGSNFWKVFLQEFGLAGDALPKFSPGPTLGYSAEFGEAIPLPGTAPMNPAHVELIGVGWTPDFTGAGA